MITRTTATTTTIPFMLLRRSSTTSTVLLLSRNVATSAAAVGGGGGGKNASTRRSTSVMVEGGETKHVKEVDKQVNPTVSWTPKIVKMMEVGGKVGKIVDARDVKQAAAAEIKMAKDLAKLGGAQKTTVQKRKAPKENLLSSRYAPPDVFFSSKAPVRKGVVVKVSSAKTVKVKVERMVRHPVVPKSYWVSKNYLVHDETEKIKVGDTVEIVETRPISKRKGHIVLRIDESGQIAREFMQKRSTDNAKRNELLRKTIAKTMGTVHHQQPDDVAGQPQQRDNEKVVVGTSDKE